MIAPNPTTGCGAKHLATIEIFAVGLIALVFTFVPEASAFK